MIRCTFFTFLIICAGYFTAQQDTNYYRINFLDKANSSYDINAPQDFLSERAIKRRTGRSIPIVQEDLPISPLYFDSVLSQPSLNYVTHSKWFNDVVVICWDTNVINTIEGFSFVQGTEEVLKMKALESANKFEQEIDRDKTTTISVNHHYPYGATYRQNHIHNLDYMHDLGFRGQGMHIAVIDAGFENANSLEGLAHLFEENRVLSTKDFVDLDGEVYQDHFHGCAVLSVIGGVLPGKFFGTAPQASFHLLRSEDADAEYIMEEDFWICAAEYADSCGVDLINSSLGYTTFDDSTQNHVYAELDGSTTRIALAANIAVNKGVFVVISAGNSGTSSWGYIGTPADADLVLAVAAIDSMEVRADFSSFGPASDGAIKPNVAAVGKDCYLIAPWDGTVIRGNGTSFSAPLMCGLVACLWQAMPDLSNTELFSLIQEHSHQYQQADEFLGYGIPNAFEVYQSQTGISYLYDTRVKIQEVFPNPFVNGSELQLTISSNKSQSVIIELTNALGQISFQESFDVLPGDNRVTITRLNDLSSGRYTIKCIDSSGNAATVGLIVID